MMLRKPAAGFGDPALQLIAPLSQLTPAAADRIQIPQVVLAEQSLTLCHFDGLTQQIIYLGSDFAHLIHISNAQGSFKRSRSCRGLI
ncbi:hypothetical protein D3C75_970830 [compost metagenome]